MSPKRLTLFDSLRREVIINTSKFPPHLGTLCPTRWTVRHASIASILRNYSIIQSALEEITQGHDELSPKASGMASKMNYFDTFFGHKLAHLIFSAAEQISMQRISLYKRQFTVLGFLQHIYCPWETTKSSEVIHDCVGLIAKPTLPCRRKAPKRFDDGASPQTYETPKDRHRRMYFEVTELIAGEVERPFIQKDLGIIRITLPIVI